jgi:predicted metalloprotease with PDZ domain
MQNKHILSPIFGVVLAFILHGSALCGGSAINYKITINPADLSGYDLEIRVPDAKGTFRLAMAAHPEYDDRYFRYVENFSAGSGGRKLTFTKPEEAVWQVDGVPRNLTIRYRIVPAAKEREWRQTWKPFLTPTGGMVGDLHMLMYVVGEEKRSARLTLDLPDEWKAATGLEPTSDPRVFTGTVEHLLDAPVIIGKFDEWKFDAGGIPHQIVIWSPPDARAVDAAPIVDGIKKLTEQAIKAFGKPSYPRYAFLLENGGQAALEHATSVNVGISRELNDTLATIGHEYVHVWNLMDVRPKERVGLRYKFAEPTGVLWWSEGATIFFSDLLIRRAGLPGDTRTRPQRLESLIARYLSAPGYSTLSAELVSRGDSHPELLGDNWAGTHLQGEVLVNMLDLKIRDATDAQRSVDDVMRLLAARFDSDRGIINSDIERALQEVCRCEMKGFFGEYIYAAKRVDFDRYLELIGMRAEIRRVTAVDSEGRPSVDLRIGPVSPEGELKLRITNSNSAWARAGIRTGDKLISANGNAIADWPAFRTWLRTLKTGDTGRVVISRDGVERIVEVPLKPFDVPSVRLVELKNATPKQARVRDAWMNARQASGSF